MITCFFCQTLLSDYIEDVLPAPRRVEIKKHLEECKRCPVVHQELSAAIELLGAMPSQPISHELALQITETAMHGAGRWLRPTTILKAGVGMGAVAGLAFGVLSLFPSVFSWIGAGSESFQLTRYYPLQNGAMEIVEEQANWLQIREPSMRSVWEEGGLSPEEFEKSFQPRGLASDTDTPEAGIETDTD